MSQLGRDEDPSFFERERDRLTREITSDFEALLLSSNTLNRKLEEIHGMTKEYSTIADLWSSFYQLMQKSGQEGGEDGDDQAQRSSAATGQPGLRVTRDSAR
ncbi:F-box domain-containing protein [Mycena venus]|uniref:DASH complex subunit DAD1 n=1 Tax=Mycena venus TaxID=2733690 RepID=A0A8H6YVG0_9AGAR|nr:F-box domain-containing protein [Mycena venus]